MATQDEILALLTDVSNKQDALVTADNNLLSEVQGVGTEVQTLIGMIGSVPGSDAILAKAQEIATKMQGLTDAAQAMDNALKAIPAIPAPPTA